MICKICRKNVEFCDVRPGGLCMDCDDEQQDMKLQPHGRSTVGSGGMRQKHDKGMLACDDQPYNSQEPRTYRP